MILNRERVLERLRQLSYEAPQTGHYSVAARCEERIGRRSRCSSIAALAVGDRTRQADANAARWESGASDERIRGKQLAVAEARRQIEAGRTRTVESIETTLRRIEAGVEVFETRLKQPTEFIQRARAWTGIKDAMISASFLACLCGCVRTPSLSPMSGCRVQEQ